MQNMFPKQVFSLASESRFLQRMVRAVRNWFLVCLAVFLGACAGPAPDAPARIAVLGDSMMAWNGLRKESAPQHLSRLLEEPVANFAVSGARMSNPLPVSSLAGFDIRQQFRKGDWDVILVNGGANDFILECGCGTCRRVLNRLIAPDGQSGQIPDFLNRLRDTGADVVYVGYHRPRQLNSPVRGCKEEVEELEARVERFVQARPGIFFASLEDVFPPGDPKYYVADRFHPSPLGSATIAERLAPFVAEVLEGAGGG